MDAETPYAIVKAAWAAGDGYIPPAPFWTGYEFSPVAAYARRYPTREAAEADLPDAQGQSFVALAIVALEPS